MYINGVHLGLNKQISCVLGQFMLAFKTDIILKRLDPLHAVQYDPLWDSFTFRTRIYDNVMNIGHAKNFDEFDM